MFHRGSVQIFKVFSSTLLFLLCNLVQAENSEFTYIEPELIEGLSNRIVTELKDEVCLVPKWFHEFGGVTEGQLSQSGQNDVAVLCKFDEDYAIRIFWGGPSKCSSKIGSLGQFISTVDKKYILDHYGYYGGKKPPKITHHGINDHYLEKSSFVKYCHEGKWLELSGAD